MRNKAEINQTLLYFFRENKIDIYYNPIYLAAASEGILDKEEVDYYNKEIEYSKVVFPDVFRIAQILKKPSSSSNLENVDLSSFLFNNIEILFMLFLGFIFSFFIIFILLRFINQKLKIKIKKFILRPMNLDQIRLLSSQAALIYVFFSLFVFIVQNTLENNIKTESVILKTDDYINSFSRLKNTQKTLIVFDYQRILLQTAPKNSDMYKLYERKLRENNIVQIGRVGFRSIMKKRGNRIEDYFIFSRMHLLYIFVFGVSKYTDFEKHFIFLNPQTYYEFIFAHYIRKSLNENIKSILNFR